MELLNKKIINKFGTHYLLGEDENGIKYWLEEPTFDCGWYWGLGYVHTFTNNRQPTKSVDINSHEHFNIKFMKNCYVQSYEQFFKKSVLDRPEIYKLFDLMECAYTLKKMAELCERGSSWISENDCYDTLKDQNWYLEIIKKKLPVVISAICNLLGGETTPEQFEKQAIYKE